MAIVIFGTVVGTGIGIVAATLDAVFLSPMVLGDVID
jgi:hypothetical protein